MPGQPGLFRIVISDALRILTFRRPTPAIAQHWPAYLAFGLFFTWLAGVGRYWDNPRADPWQYLGLGSVVYVFVLALLLWLMLWPLRPRNWSYRSILVFVTLTSPPAVLYAIPVEHFMSMRGAQLTNAWFLAIVATWRMALLVWFLRVVGGLSRFAVAVAALLPMTFIIVTLTILNLEHVVFNIMAGIQPEDPSQNDIAYEVVFFLSLWSVMLFPFLLLAYIGLVIHAWWWKPRKASQG